MVAIDLPLQLGRQSIAAFSGQQWYGAHFRSRFAEHGWCVRAGWGNRYSGNYHKPAKFTELQNNLRQAMSDLWTLSASVGNIPGVNATQKVLSASRWALLSVRQCSPLTTLTSATSQPRRRCCRLLAGSPAFGPAIVEGLAAAGIE